MFLCFGSKGRLLLELNMGMQSELNKGSVFYIDIPYGILALISEIQIIKQQSPISKLIWVIEDDDVIRYSLEKLLQSWQCRITKTCDPLCTTHIIN